MGFLFSLPASRFRITSFHILYFPFFCWYDLVLKVAKSRTKMMSISVKCVGWAIAIVILIECELKMYSRAVLRTVDHRTNPLQTLIHFVDIKKCDKWQYLHNHRSICNSFMDTIFTVLSILRRRANNPILVQCYHFCVIKFHLSWCWLEDTALIWWWLCISVCFFAPQHNTNANLPIK